MNKYSVIDELKISGKTLITLNEKRSVTDMGKAKAVIDGIPYSYSHTHNDFSLIINTQDSLKGKTIYFE